MHILSTGKQNILLKNDYFKVYNIRKHTEILTSGLYNLIMGIIRRDSF